jgi:L-threonylcarbamoyladenylate synthase
MPANAPQTLRPDAAGIAQAAALLARGALIALPTETVYGLAADARDDRAVARIYEAKGRPGFNPLIVHLPDLAAVEALAELPGAARELAAAFWPGPMTLVLPLRSDAGLSPLVTAGLDTLAIRLPAHPVMRAVLRQFGGPVAAPSANPSGRISATSADHVRRGLGARVDAILDAGPCAIGVESTILAPGPTGTRLLREGGLTREEITGITGPLIEDATPGKIEAPGQLSSHYAPGVPLYLDGVAQPGEVTIGFGTTQADLTLSASGDLVEAATRLFAVLHAADALAVARGAQAIRVAQVPDTGLGRAINDRLRRAAAPRP